MNKKRTPKGRRRGPLAILKSSLEKCIGDADYFGIRVKRKWKVACPGLVAQRKKNDQATSGKREVTNSVLTGYAKLVAFSWYNSSALY